jgi:hypothetical protein
MTEKKSGSLREVMPVTAEIVDWLRTQLGTAAADRIVQGGKAGRGSFWAREVGPDGQVREFGSRHATRWPSEVASEKTGGEVHGA